LRLFVAVFPPPEVQHAAARAIEALRRPNDGVSWVKPDNLHFTMRFIGEVGDDGARRVTEAVREAVRGRPAFDAALGGLGAFPNPRRARVIWVGLGAGEAPMVDLARALESGLERRGFDRERQKFSAHLTLGRVRVHGSDWTERLAPAAPEPASHAAPEPARFRVSRLAVVQSQLSPKGSIYTVCEAPELAG
jgi:RNA 2',3'-cyclic 3'-phosphodiesterase